MDIKANRLRVGGAVAVAFLLGISVGPGSVQAAVNYFNETKVVSGAGSASCPYGWKLTGGGVGTIPSDYFGSNASDEYKLTGSMPSSNSWRATGTRVHGSYSSYSDTWRFTTFGFSPRVYAVCTR